MFCLYGMLNLYLIVEIFGPFVIFYRIISLNIFQLSQISTTFYVKSSGNPCILKYLSHLLLFTSFESYMIKCFKSLDFYDIVGACSLLKKKRNLLRRKSQVFCRYHLSRIFQSSRIFQQVEEFLRTVDVNIIMSIKILTSDKYNKCSNTR